MPAVEIFVVAWAESKPPSFKLGEDVGQAYKAQGLEQKPDCLFFSEAVSYLAVGFEDINGFVKPSEDGERPDFPHIP